MQSNANRKEVNQVAIRVKTYANKDDKAAGKVGHVQAAGTVEEFQLLAKGDKEAKDAFDKAVKDAVGKA